MASTQEKTNSRIIQLTIVLAIVGTLPYILADWTDFSFKDDLVENGSSIFMKYFFIIVALERAAAVWTGIDRGKDKRAWDRRVRRVRELLAIKFDDVKLPELKQSYSRESRIIKEIKGSVDDPYTDDAGKPAKYSAEEEKEALVGYLRSVKHVYEFRRSRHEQVTYEYTTRIVFVGGVILAIIGLSVVSDIIDVSTVYSDWQHFFYKLADIAVTGGLLGGGSKSFSVFINTLDSVFDRVKDSNDQ